MNISHADDSNIVINQELLDILQPLMEPCDRNTYSQRLKDAVEKLGKSKRTVQRLMKLWQEEGIQAFTNGPRLDKGRPRMSEDWQKFIVKTYEQGNQADKKMTPAQVALKVKVEAARLGDKCPSHMSVYRLLAPIIERRAQKKSLRSPGWQGSRLVLSTQRRVQRGGIVQLENLIYKGENLIGYEGTQVSLRYDPKDITTVWVYRRDGGKEEFLTRAFAQGLEITTLTLADSQSARRELRQTSQSINNSSILAEVERREQDVAKSVKARRQKAQVEFKLPAQSSISEQEGAIEETQQSPVTILEPIKTWDLDEEY
jgi:Mu transposase, C-terminal/Winged helix-turn helix